LVLVHGITGSYTAFLPFVAALAAKAHVYALDLRGHYRSGHTPGAYELSDYGRDLASFLERVVRRPATVAGHSLGALVAVWVAANAPDRVHALLLEEPPLYITQLQRLQESPFYGFFVALRAQLAEQHAAGRTVEDLALVVGQMPVDAERTMAEVAGPAGVLQRALELQWMDPTLLDAGIEGRLLGGSDPDELLAQVRCPAHLLVGQTEFGSALSPQDVHRALSKLAYGTHTLFEGVGHSIHEERPDAYVRALSGVLDVAQARD